MSEITNESELMYEFIESIEEPATRQFYLHIDKNTLDIVSVTPMLPDNDNITYVEITEEQAIKFLTGQDLIQNYGVILTDNKYSVTPISVVNRIKNSRVDVLTLEELKISNATEFDVDIFIDTEKNKVAITYNGDAIANLQRPLMLYFTRENDPHYLKETFKMDIASMNDLKKFYNLKEWPNPVIFSLENADDTSVFTAKSNLIITLSKI